MVLQACDAGGFIVGSDMSGVVTILFTDLVGSTPMSERLGDERVSRLRQEHFRLLEDAAARHGGTVVKSTGDGLMVVFPSAVDGAASAVDMQRAVHAHNQRQEMPLAMRIGLHIGEPELADGDYYGTPVSVASRLCAAAAGGQIIASDVLRAIVGSRSGPQFRNLGPMELKGIDEPVSAWEIAWEPARHRIPLPPLVAQGGAPLVGRAQELDMLRRGLRQAAGGVRSFLLVAGEPGIGKTRLVFEAAREAHDSGSTVLYGRSLQEAAVPYQPFVQALHHLAAHRPDDVRVAGGTALGPLMPDIDVGSMPTAGDPEMDRYRLFDAVGRVLAAQANPEPLMIILDDLHWADAPTLTLLRHVLGDPAVSSTLIVGTYRDIELDRRHPLSDVLAELRREGLFERIRLRGLSEGELEELFAQLAGHELDDRGKDLARALHEETEGNPFFVREILRHLVETGAIQRRDGRWTSDRTPAEVGLPESVREVIGRRLSRLSEECGDVLAIASVLGRDFDLSVLARLAGQDQDRLADLLDEALGVGGVLQELPGSLGSYTFAHALVQETLYEELSTNRRIRLHRRAGEAFEQLYADDLVPYLGELAHHFQEAAAAGATEKAIAYSRHAGARAVERLAFEEAPAHFERALQALELGGVPDPELRCELLLELGEAYRLTVDTEACRRTCAAAADIARSEGWTERLGRAALTYGGLWIDVGLVRQELVDLLETAAGGLPDDHPMVPLLYGRLAMELFSMPRSEEKLAYSHRAVESARHVGDPRTLSYALIARRHAVSGPRCLDERLAITTEAISLARSIGDLDLDLRARAFRLVEHMERADLAAAEAEYEEFFRLATESRLPIYTYVSDLFRAGIALREGRLEEAEALEPFLADWAWRQNRITAIVATSVQRLVRNFLRGTPLEVDEEAIDAVRLFVASDPVHVMKGAWLDLLLGRTQQSRETFERELGTALSPPPDDWDYLSSLSILADLSEAFGTTEATGAIYEHARPFEDRIVCVAGTALVTVGGTVADVLGICSELAGRLDEAVSRYQRAVELNRGIRARPFAVRSTMRLARVMLARGADADRERATNLLDEALREADDMGLGAPFVHQARALRMSEESP